MQEVHTGLMNMPDLPRLRERDMQDTYYKTGLCQYIARSQTFENATMAVIAVSRWCFQQRVEGQAPPNGMLFDLSGENWSLALLFGLPGVPCECGMHLLWFSGLRCSVFLALWLFGCVLLIS